MVSAPLPVPSAPQGSPGEHAVTLTFLPPFDHGVGSSLSLKGIVVKGTVEHFYSTRWWLRTN